MGVAPERPKSFANKNIQAQRKQYGLKHRDTGTIHWAMGDTLYKVASQTSATDDNFRDWDKGINTY